MKDAIIVRESDWLHSVMKGRIGEEKWKDDWNFFLIILLPILGLVFLGGKIMNLTKRPEQKVTASSSKKVVQKSEEEIKRANRISKEHESKKSLIMWGLKIQKIESVQIDWTDVEMEWWRFLCSRLFYWSLWNSESYWRFRDGVPLCRLMMMIQSIWKKFPYLTI